MSDTSSLDALIQALRRVPGVGQKCAQRKALSWLRDGGAGALVLGLALAQGAGNGRLGQRC